MQQRKWTGLKFAVYLALTVHLFYLVRTAYLCILNFDTSNQYPIGLFYYLRFMVPLIFFVLYQLLNARLIRHHLPQHLSPSKKYLHFHGFLLVMNTTLLFYYVYLYYQIYRDAFLLWDEFENVTDVGFYFSTLILLLAILANIYTILYAGSIRKYLKLQALKAEESMLASIGE